MLLEGGHGLVPFKGMSLVERVRCCILMPNETPSRKINITNTIVCLTDREILLLCLTYLYYY